MVKKTVKPGAKPGAKPSPKPVAPPVDPLEDFDLSVGVTPTPAVAAPEPGAPGEDSAGEAVMDTSVSVEGIQESVKKAGQAGPFLYFKDGDKKEVRFLDDLREGVRVPRHEQFDRGLKPTTCLKVYGEDCSYCNEDIPARDWYAWNVIDFTSGAIKVLCMKAVRNGVVSQLGAWFAENGSTKKTNFVISQVGSGKEKALTITPRQRNNSDDKAKIARAIQTFMPKRLDLKETLRPAEAGGGGNGLEGGGFELNVEGEPS